MGQCLQAQGVGGARAAHAAALEDDQGVSRAFLCLVDLMGCSQLPELGFDLH